MYYVYVLRSLKDFNLYYGFTHDLKKRFKDHNEGNNVSTANRKPWQLIYYEAYISIEDAKHREIFTLNPFLLCFLG